MKSTIRSLNEIYEEKEIMIKFTQPVENYNIHQTPIIPYEYNKKITYKKQYASFSLTNLLSEANVIRNALYRDYDFSNLSRDMRIYINYPRCGICIDFCNLSNPDNCLFCPACETIVHEKCLLSINENYENKIIRRDVSYFKGRYTSEVVFGGVFICDKCSDIKTK